MPDSASLFSSFRSRNYRWMWLITAFTNAGSWTFTMVVTWQVYELTHHSSWSGAIMFATLAPNIVGGPIAGVLADFTDRRYLMFFSALSQITITALLGVLTMINVVTPPLILVLSLLFGFGSSTLSVALSSLLPTLVPKDRLLNAFSLQAVAQRGTEFAGPAVASPLMMVGGAAAVYFFATFLYVLVSSVVFALSRPSQSAAPMRRTRGILNPLLAGFRYIGKSGSITVVITLVGFHCALTMAFMGMLPQFVKLSLHGDSAFYGFLMSNVGLGAILGTLLLANVRHGRVRGWTYWIAAVLSGLSLALLGVCHSHSLAVVAVVLVGSSQAVFMTLSLAYVQEMSDDHMRGRVSSVYFVLAGGFMSIANLGFGSLSNVISPEWIMMTVGLVFVVVVLVYAVVSKQFRTVSRYGTFGPAGIGGTEPGVASLR